MAKKRWEMSEPLGRALHSLRMNGAFYSRAEWTAPWGLTLPPMGNLWFHAVISGQALLEVPGARPTWLGRGDLGLVAHGKGHVLRSDSSADALDLSQLDDARMISDRYEEIRHGGGGCADHGDLRRLRLRPPGGPGGARHPAPCPPRRAGRRAVGLAAANAGNDGGRGARAPSWR